MTLIENKGKLAAWSVPEKILTVATFLFVLAVVVPLDPVQAFNHAVSLGVPNRYYLGGYMTRSGSDYDFTNFFLTALGTVVLATVWVFFDKKQKGYPVIAYWAWVLARFKVADVMFWFGIEKVLPIQMPFPTLSYLNTNLGDIHPWKLYWLTTGSAPAFEVFCGVFEVLAAVLLLFRPTATLGALAMTAITIPIIAVNFGYDAGVQRSATLIQILLTVVLAYDFKGLWNFFVLRKEAVLREAPVIFAKNWQKYLRTSLFLLFLVTTVVLRGIGMYDWWVKGESDKLPKTKGVASFYGYYTAPEFQFKNQELPLDYTDTLRWHNVVFEKWNTLSVKTNEPVYLRAIRQAERPYKEVLGVAGRHYYFYQADTLAQTIKLTYKSDSTRTFTFRYDQQPGFLKLRGITQSGDSVRVVLHKQNKQYPLVDGRKDKVYQP